MPSNEDSSAAVVANRNEAIPVINVPGQGEGVSSANDGSSRSEQHKRSRSAQRLEKMKGGLREKIDPAAASAATGVPVEQKISMQDRLMNMVLAQMLPTEAQIKDEGLVDRRSRQYVDRPGFSLPAMSNNFRRFNARIGVVFVFQNRMIRLFSWKTPTHTLAFLALYSFLVLDPTLVAIVPLAMCIFYIMIPAFLARHPPPSDPAKGDLIYPLSGPPLAPPSRIKPAPELSKDFFRNMRDLQNSMEDFSRAHDQLIETVGPPTNFSNEALSSTIFLFLLLTSFALFISAHLIPWRALLLVGGWAAIGSAHPRVQEFLESMQDKDRMTTNQKNVEKKLNDFIDADFILESVSEKREVEVFELQYRPLHYGRNEAAWEPYIFGPHAYTPLSPLRISGDRPRGTRFFEDVEPPRGWNWADKKWELDLLSKEWVEERCITGVEVEVEGERWVSDILYDEDGNAVQMAGAQGEMRLRPKVKVRDKVITWEEGVGGQHVLGEWRRRRWVRAVERLVDRKVREEVLSSAD